MADNPVEPSGGSGDPADPGTPADRLSAVRAEFSQAVDRARADLARLRREQPSTQDGHPRFADRGEVTDR